MSEEEIKIEESVVPKAKPALNLPGAIVVAAIIIGAALFMTRGSGIASQKTPDKLDLVSEVTAADFIRGNPDAPVTLIEYADFSCHYCAQYHPTLAKLVNDYQGKVRWVYRHLPIFNVEAAVASTCVGKTAGNEAFWKFSDMLFANQKSFNTDFYRDRAIASGAKGEDYYKCIADPLVKSKIEKDANKTKILLGFDATPYNVLIDKSGHKFSFAGALSEENLKAAIDGILE